MNDIQRNRLAFRLLRSFCPRHLLEEIEGDLFQKSAVDSKALGASKAKRRLLWNVIWCLRPGIILRRKIAYAHDPMDMWLHQIKFSTRILLKDNINISPLYHKVNPLVMRLPWTREFPDFFVYVRYRGDPKSVIKSVEEKYKGIMPGYPLNYHHVDELFDGTHQQETKVFASLQFGTLVIVLISVLGILSMAMYMSVKRMREFGIRKVLGASVAQIAALHLKYFVHVALLSCMVALPVAFLLVKEWLTTFAYRVDLSYLPFVLVALVSVVAVILSAGHSAWKSGRMNPIDVIKME